MVVSYPFIASIIIILVFAFAFYYFITNYLSSLAKASADKTVDTVTSQVDFGKLASEYNPFQ